MLDLVSKEIFKVVDNYLSQIENTLDCNVIYIDAPIEPFVVDLVNDTIRTKSKRILLNNRLGILLTTNGGDVNSAERLVNIFRNFYDQVDFIIPDHAYSAGTILAMSGNKIWMNYNSVLGPIDPQVLNKEGHYVPALGYLEKIEELKVKAQNDDISQAELSVLQSFDLAELSRYEQARDLAIDLLKQWLVKYKFANCLKTAEEKDILACSIATSLSDYKRWKSHGRPLNFQTVEELGLELSDFGKNQELECSIINLYNIMREYMSIRRIEELVYMRGSSEL